MLDICTLASERGGTNRMFVSPCTPRHIHFQNFTENAIETRKNFGGNASWGETHIISSLTAKPTNLKPQNLQRTACLLTRKNRRNPTVSCSLHFLSFIKIYSFLDFVYTQTFTDSKIRVKFGVEELIDGWLLHAPSRTPMQPIWLIPAFPALRLCNKHKNSKNESITNSCPTNSFPASWESGRITSRPAEKWHEKREEFHDFLQF